MTSSKHRPPRTRGGHYFWLVVRDIQQMSIYEWAAVGLTLGAIAYFLSYAGVSWRTAAFTIAMLICGYFMGDMARRLWWGG